VSVQVFLDSDELSGDVWSISVARGKSLETEVIDAGTATINVHNILGDYNPYFLSDPFALLQENDDFLLLENGDHILLEFGNGTGGSPYGDIVVGRELTVIDGGVTVFTGFVEDYDYDYGRANNNETTISAVDALATLGATWVNEDWPTERPILQLTGERLESLLDWADVSFPSGGSARDIDTGTQPVQEDVLSSATNALGYAQTIARTEVGRLYINRSGRLDFRDRYSAFDTTPVATFSDVLGADLDISKVSVRFGTESFYFSVTADNGVDYGVLQQASNAGVASQYPNLGARNLDWSGILSASQDHTYGTAEFLVGRLSETRAVVSGLRVPLPRLSSVDRAAVCALDIGSVIAMSWTPVGSAGAVNQTLVIEGVNYSADSSGQAIVEFQLSDASDPGYFQVDTDAVDGPKLVAP
jgi:hypothetical protein